MSKYRIKPGDLVRIVAFDDGEVYCEVLGRNPTSMIPIKYDSVPDNIRNKQSILDMAASTHEDNLYGAVRVNEVGEVTHCRGFMDYIIPVTSGTWLVDGLGSLKHRGVPPKDKVWSNMIWEYHLRRKCGEIQNKFRGSM